MIMPPCGCRWALMTAARASARNWACSGRATFEEIPYLPGPLNWMTIIGTLGSAPSPPGKSGPGNGGTGSTNLSLGNGGVLTYTSGVAGVTPPAGSTAEFAYTLLNVTPNFGATSGDALNSFTAKGDGEFDFTGGGVPEPATWALMIMGFGGAGVLLRRRRQAATFA